MSLSTTAIIPVRGHGALLQQCLQALFAQAQPVDEVIVVDDSPDGSLEPIDGVRILRSGGQGPYAARNIAAAETGSDILLFLDSRSRPRAPWVERTTARFSDVSIAIVGSDVLVSTGPSLAAAASHAQQFARLRNYLAAPYFRPYLPTCNLAVRRADFLTVGGFPTVRSGGDAELCWRVLELPGRRLDAVEEVLMDWVPRTSTRELLEQNYRYGKSSFALRTRWHDKGASVPAPLPYWRLVRRTAWVAARAAAAWARRDRERLVAYVAGSAQLCSDWGYRVASGRARTPA